MSDILDFGKVRFEFRATGRKEFETEVFMLVLMLALELGHILVVLIFVGMVRATLILGTEDAVIVCDAEVLTLLLHAVWI